MNDTDSASDIPSGQWTGFYQQLGQHRQDLSLSFARGVVAGSGSDSVGRFVIAGTYELTTSEVRWTKRYLGAHAVAYRGFYEGGAIWGTWRLPPQRGGFKIWPRQAESLTATSEAQHEPAHRAVTADPCPAGAST